MKERDREEGERGEGGRGGKGRERRERGEAHNSGTSDEGPSEIGTTSLQGTRLLAP